MLLIRKSIIPVAQLGILLLLFVHATANSVSLAESMEEQEEDVDASEEYFKMTNTSSEILHSRHARQAYVAPANDTPAESTTCSPGLVLPLWMPQKNISVGDRALRGLVYFLLMVYLFVGVSIISDRFMGAIEAITSIERTVTVKTPDGNKQPMRVRVWNETVANLTLMALGSSAPEILLSVIEIYAKDFESGDLGPGTIVGSAAYNLFVIIALCMVLIPKGERRRIKHLRVFIVTAIFSVFAYIWLWIILSVVSPGIIEVWESLITLIMFPIIVLWAYIAERRLLVYKLIDKKFRVNKRGTVIGGEHDATSDTEHPGPVGADLTTFDYTRREYVAVLTDLRIKYPDADLEQLEMMAQEQMMARGSKSRAFYRIQATRKLIGNRNVHRNTNDRTSSEIQEAKLYNDDDVTRIYFEPGHYTVMENCGEFEVRVVRRGDISKYSKVDFETQDGTAAAGSDYVGKKGVLTFPPGVDEQRFKIEVIDDDIFEEDECFYIRLVSAENGKIVIPQIATVMILDDDHAGIFAFTNPEVEINESVGICDLVVMRYSGARGVVKVPYWTEDGTAIAGKHYQAVQGELTFTNNMTEQFIAIPIIEESSYEKNVHFTVRIGTPELAPDDELIEKIQELEKRPVEDLNDLERIMLMSRPRAGEIDTIQVFIRESAEFRATVDKLMAKARVSTLGTSTWKDQFKGAIILSADESQFDGLEADYVPTCIDYICHFLSLFWKILFAFVPPTDMCGGYLTFVVSIFVIGVITAIIGDAATYFGCALNIKDSVTAICFVALGTSIPDTFASIIASKQDETADNCVGNVTGSNAVNVFLGIGLAWSLAAIYHMANGSTFNVEPGTIGFAVALFCGEAMIAIFIMMYRRINTDIRAELGGPSPSKWIHASILFILWIIYLTVSTMEAYKIIHV